MKVVKVRVIVVWTVSEAKANSLTQDNHKKTVKLAKLWVNIALIK